MLATSTSVSPRRRELDFQLFDVLEIDKLLATPHFAEHDRATLDAILDAAYEIAGDYFAPLAAELDAFDYVLDDGNVATPARLKTAVRAFIDAGFMGASFLADDGGLQLPSTLSSAAGLVFAAANGSANSYAFLTVGAAHLLAAFGDDEQRERWMKPMIEGRYFGTMALSEAQAGSALAEVQTKAVPAADGTYRLSGNKMWISAAEHDLSENIVNLVLAKLPDAPPGVKGISLFIVPKFLVDADGSIGKRNDVVVTGLNHKLGQRGVVNTVLTFGETGECVGYLVGKPHDGMRQMFHMMNEARISVGAGAASLSIAAYEYSLQYAKDRPQGRLPSDKNPLSPQVAIVEHPDVRRMLLEQKAIAEGGLALVLYCAHLVDVAAASTGEVERRNAELLVDVLTPVAKTWPSERGIVSTSLAIQVLGGYGYSPEYPVERHFRDQRLNPIHEGTTGIQGLDLLGRKVRLADGAGLTLLVAAIRADIDAARAHATLADECDRLAEMTTLLPDVTKTLLQAQIELGPDRALAEATAYLDAFGTVVVAWRWLVMATRAAAAAADDDFNAGKLAACRYFYRYELRKTKASLEHLATLDDAIASVRTEML
ncbi:MAG: acyl-CoA dehydrogenase [Candidatus Eremiobacteraeota bacterium]|nr:acyl-CoA dehydrogenase [Candidatus Eremiobacteraeota bacterium]